VFPCFRGGIALLLAGALAACGLDAERGSLPTKLSDEDFWNLSTSLSEPSGVFPYSDNLVSNELLFVHALQRLRPRGGVYIGVGPEQNFSYIARIEPAIAFIVDIRQENRNLHLLYKALFETSSDRVQFLSRLFSRDRPAGLAGSASVHDLFAAYHDATPSGALFDATTRLVRERLVDAHHLPLSPDDLTTIDYVLHAFYTHGPDIDYGRSRPDSDPRPSYRKLMTARDLSGESRNYLASEDAFRFVKDLQARNLIVPVVGDFATPQGAITRVGQYVRQHGSSVSAFYGSNVEVYLSKQQMVAFCDNLLSLPATSRTSFINSKLLFPLSTRLDRCGPRAAK
jgi:hypothetical protein